MKQKIDVSKWNRKEHFELFSKMDSPYVGIVTDVDCTNAYRYCKTHKISFFATYLHDSMKAINQVSAFKYRIEEDGVYLYDTLDAGTTIGRPDGTFGFAFMKYDADFEIFNQRLQEQIAMVNSQDGLCVRNEDLTLGLVRHSTFPWSKFSGLIQPTNFNYLESIPRIIFGKAFEENGQMRLPLSIEGNHGLIDGFHIAQYLTHFEAALSTH